MSNLAMEAMLAREAGMSYGKWKALQTVKEFQPKPDPRMAICPECGKQFLKKSPRHKYCEFYCQQHRSVRRHRERKNNGE